MDAGHLLAEAADDIGAVQAQIVGIAAHEADGIGGARQVVVAALLDRLEIGQADAQLVGDGLQLLAAPLALQAQDVADAQLNGRPQR